MPNHTKPTTSFYVIAIIALIWNLMGVVAYFSQAFMTEDMRALMPAEQLAFMENTPAWATLAFAIAVWSGVLASFLLLIKKKMAITGFIVSFLGVVVQFFYNFFIANGLETYGPMGLLMPLCTLSFGLFLIWYSKKCSDDGILN